MTFMSDEECVRQILLAADKMRDQLLQSANFRVYSTDGYANMPSLNLKTATAVLEQRRQNNPVRTWEIAPQDEAAQAIMEYDRVVLQMWGGGR